MRLAGYDKDINAFASKEEFMKQAQEYREMVKGNAWDKTLEFLTLSRMSHPLMTVRALECEEWASSDQYQKIVDGSYILEDVEEEADEVIEEANGHEGKKGRLKFELPKFKKKAKPEDASDDNEQVGGVSIPDEIRKYKELMDDGIITEDEFNAKKAQLLDL